jgi:hypothetical protein
MDSQHDKGKGTTFGRQMMQYIANRLPFAGTQQLIDNINEVNPKFKHFFPAGSNREQLLSKHSISQLPSTPQPHGAIQIDKNYHQFMYANVDHDKGKRLRDYRVMAAFSEVADALDEICDDVITKDEQTDEIIKVKFKVGSDLSNQQEEEIKKEFHKFVNHFELEKNGWVYFRKLLVEGELFFEHIVHEKHTEAGILGIVSIPTESMDIIYDNVQNLLVKGYLLRKPIFNEKTNAIEKFEYIPLEKNQVTYINSGIWNENKTMQLPFIENCRRAYRQLSLIEDSIVIYRLVRAPERLVFNVDVGNMPPPKAEAYLKQLMHNYWSRKTYDKSQGGTINAFNPQSMLDSFWFAKRAGSEGTQVNQLQGGQNLGELTDLMYFVKKLYKSLKVPSSRLEPESQYNDSATILREELKFARFIIRLQQSFAEGIKQSFVTHLQLKNLWDKYKLKENMISLDFVAPTAFHQFREQQLFELKYNNFNSMAGNQEVSTTYAQKKWLEWSDTEIKQNREWLKKDAAMQFELGQIVANGPNWREGVADAESGPGQMPGGSAGPMGSSSPIDIEQSPPSAEVPASDIGGDTPGPAPASSTETSALPS